MAHILRNSNVEIRIDFPQEIYKHARFDWTGMVSEVKYLNKPVSGFEKLDGRDDSLFGKGFYNEFGIVNPLGFEEAKIGDWFHKIGIGLLRKEESQYYFHKEHEIKPAQFSVIKETDKIIFKCKSPEYNDFSYLFEKEIILRESGFEVKYHLENTGQQKINTSEYNHNFLAIDKDLIGSDYILKFPFQLNPKLFGETVNPEQLIEIGKKEIRFLGNLNEEFFFSNLSGGSTVEAKWELENIRSKIGISETVNSPTNSINLWGRNHVISPELFIDIEVNPGSSKTWTRAYHLYELE